MVEFPANQRIRKHNYAHYVVLVSVCVAIKLIGAGGENFIDIVHDHQYQLSSVNQFFNKEENKHV